MWRYLQGAGDYRMMVLADHATPVAIRTHVSDPAPFVMAGKGVSHNGFDAYNETNARSSEMTYKSGAELTEALMEK